MTVRDRSVAVALTLLVVMAAFHPSAVADGWTSAAEAAATKLLKGPDAPVIAGSVQKICHPTGDRAELRGFTTAHAKDPETGVMYASVLMTIAWRGPLGGSRSIVVNWSFSRRGHGGAIVTSDDNPLSVSQANAQRLDDYFRDKIYPVLVAKMRAQ